MTSEEENNPFRALITESKEKTEISSSSSPQMQINPLDKKINSLVEDVFKISVNANPMRKVQLVFMEDFAERSNCWSLDILSAALFDRLMMDQPQDFVIPNDVLDDNTNYVVESRALVYLFQCYARNAKNNTPNDSIKLDAYSKIKEMILLNTGTLIKQPDIRGQCISSQIIHIFSKEDDEVVGEFLSGLVKEVLSDGDPDSYQALKTVFDSVFADMKRRVQAATLITLEGWIIPSLMHFVSDKSNPKLAEFLLDNITPAAQEKSCLFSASLVGQLLRLSILPKNGDLDRYEYYDNPLDAQSQSLNSSLYSALTSHLDSMHRLFKGFLLIGSAVRDKLLQWFGNCLHVNAPRGQIWNPMMAGNLSIVNQPYTAPDSFMIGLTGVLLRLCQPLFRPNLKVLLVDPTYCAAKTGDQAVHMIDINKETCLLPSTENEERITSETYNFITECFYMTHKAIDLSYRICIEKFFKMNRQVARLQNEYQAALASGSTPDSLVVDQFKSEMKRFLSLQNTLIEPFNDSLLLHFYEATAIWLAQIAGMDSVSSDKGFAPQTAHPIDLPLTKPPSVFLKSIPEFLLENIVVYLTFIRHFESQAIDTDLKAQNALFTLILIFIGDSNRVRNPHLRARLAEALESLIPQSKPGVSMFRTSWKSALFTSHPHRLEIVRNLLNVFVGIEVTGQSVAFEQKFNYRRPMYIIMEYLWSMDEQKECFKALALEAEQNMDAVDPPIFLRFINLLINDAIYLLDESLSNLQQIRTLQHARDSGEWNSLPATERNQNVRNLEHLGMIAKFDNIMGKDTINILKLLTSEINGTFCAPSMVDRVAAMLNYFLLNLTGPNNRNFNVRDKKEFQFDPANTVLEICRIYTNLQNSRAFCLAVSQDGRSYSQKLFEYAEQVLVRIGGGQLIGEISDFALNVHRLEQEEKAHQEALTDAPDEFLDPIMSTLMLDPVILPSSKVTVDRATIARHLLSDQSDMFNRAPLTMDQVMPNTELKAQIDAWVKEKLAAYNANTSKENN
ncbi:ubiquitin conjugation factor E4 A isoform X1 [Bradysia coprophila]|uniref:ubiquitin conjugation factor E4 A isoform X1 n=1 Tax=Bradysia coprophila TaxID=38358 RepID=UPI00187DAEE0|nr:ubiquitin conjugation factor E4 A isoform X1 [Bradysia coprophila]